MSLDRTDIEKIARLARLEINEGEMPEYKSNLSNILALVEQLESVETQGITPMAHPLELNQRLRDDVVSEENEREKFQAIAPQVEAGLYLVPKVLE